jgi:hypothetical protein
MDQARTSVGPWRRLARFSLPPAGGRIAASFQHLKARLWLFALIALVCGIYAYFMTAGSWKYWPVYGVFHDLQADGFRTGHLSLALTPPPELLAAKDPYDRANMRYWALDVSLYHGKYYIYWGPVPALLQAAGKILLGIRRGIGDQYVEFFCACLAFLSGALLVERMGRRLFPSISRALLAAGVLAFAFANPALHLVTSAGTYQTAIVCAQAWMLVGLVAAFDVVWYAGSSAARRRHMFGAGAAWGLAIASRVTFLPTVAILIGVTALAAGWTSERRWRSVFASALALGLPVALTGFALLLYNKLRFEHWLEFGLNLQLSGYPKMRFAAAHWLPNLYSYSLRPWKLSCQFPYLYQVWWMNTAAFPDGFVLPPGYMVDEPVIGWLRAAPITWLIPFAFVVAPRERLLGLRHNRVYLWCLISFGALASVSGLTSIGVYGATMRYLGDVTSGLVLVALLGGYALKTSRFGKLIPKLTTSVFSLLAGGTVVIGILLGYQGYNGHFHIQNPKLDAAFVKALSLCGDRPPEVPRFTPR